MKYRQLGKWGSRLSVLGLGSYLTIGYKADEETSRIMVRTAYDHGINFIDTANAYNRGGAEATLGRCLSEFPRSSLFVLTKVWAPDIPAPTLRVASEECPIKGTTGRAAPKVQKFAR